jgi:hypothetical protein
MRKIKIISAGEPEMDFLDGEIGYADVTEQGLFMIYFLKGAPYGLKRTLLLHPQVLDLGPITIRPAVEIFYQQMSEVFNGYDLYKRVCSALNREPYADSIFRRMRELKERGVIHFECLNDSKSIYKKK